MTNTDRMTAEERLSHLSSKLSSINEFLQMSSKSASSMIAELQCEIEDIYISLESDEDDVQIEGRDSDG